MSIKVYKDGKLQQVAGNADTRLTKDDVISILGYTPADSSKIGVSEGFATLDSNGKLSESQKPIYDWSEINNIPSIMDAATISLSCTGNSASATQLETSRVLTIGNTGKSFNGSSDVSWSLDEMGVAPSSHSHGASDLPYFIANNDTTIDVTLSAVGWYRIAIWGDGTPVNAAGSICNSCEIIFKRQYSTVNNEYHKISLLGIYQKSNFVSELSKSNTQLITKIRHVVDTISNVSYIEFYYNGTNSNALAVTLNNATSRGRKWTLITPELTDETADGVTVYSTMAIPANSKGTASYDSDGNVITETYATKTQIDTINSNLFIQTCHKSVQLSQAGWYRICCVPTQHGHSPIPYFIGIGQAYYSNKPTTAMLVASECYQYGYLEKITSHRMDSNNYTIDKVRLSGSLSEKYVDVHIISTLANYYSFSVTSPRITWVLDYVEDANAGTVYAEIDLFS